MWDGRLRHNLKVQPSMQNLVIGNLKRLLVNNKLPVRLSSEMARSMSAAVGQYNFETLRVSAPANFVFHVEINRPEKRNAMNMAFWKEMVTCFNKLATDADCRVVIFSGAGKTFTAGLDVKSFASDIMPQDDADTSRRALRLQRIIAELQESFTVIERCPKPVIAAIQDGCIGAGVDLITACDIRYCTSDAYFQVKEVDLGIVADVGTLQRLPKVVGNESLVRELCYTARKLFADEAKQFGLVSRIFANKDAMMAGALQLATLIASKSPVAVQGTKETLIYSRDHSVDDSLRQVRTLNQSLLQSEDVMKAVTGAMSKEQPVFAKL